MGTREQIIETTSQLLEQQGYCATGLGQMAPDLRDLVAAAPR